MIVILPIEGNAVCALSGKEAEFTIIVLVFCLYVDEGKSVSKMGRTASYGDKILLIGRYHGGFLVVIFYLLEGLKYCETARCGCHSPCGNA